MRTCRTALGKSSLQDDSAVVLEAVRAFGWSLRYASNRLRNDKAVVLAAVSSFGQALEVHVTERVGRVPARSPAQPPAPASAF